MPLEEAIPYRGSDLIWRKPSGIFRQTYSA